jgi:hypothetical protein
LLARAGACVRETEPRFGGLGSRAQTVEPANRSAHRDALPLRETVEAEDTDAALQSGELTYRRRYPNVDKLRSSVMRVHRHG